MPVAAIPAYLAERNLAQASPGMRFGMYLPIWARREDQERRVNDMAKRGSREGKELRDILETQGMDEAIAHMREREKSFPGVWGKDVEGAKGAWKRICALGGDDKDRMAALLERQCALAGGLPGACVWRIDARATAPFTTGLGNEHPLENGFAFLWPYGLPYLPGSGVKGVVRQAARELAQGLWDDGSRGAWKNAPLYLVGDRKDKVLVDGLSMIDVLFGNETEGGETEHFRGVLTFWDVFPQIERLMVEIMTPHQKHYYQDGQPPHDSGDPTPISFLTVAPKSRFVFHVACDEARLARLMKTRVDGAPDLLAEDRTHWRELLTTAFEHAFQWLGFGAKTAVGYGAMVEDPTVRERKREAERREQERRRDEQAAKRAVEEEARRRAEWEAKPAHEKAKVEVEKLLKRLPASGSLDKDTHGQLTAALRTWMKSAVCESEDVRQKIADEVVAVYERLGWAPSGVKSDKRQKQEEKKKREVDEFRRGG